MFFGGKGGVGKTTCAAAWALGEARAGRRVLVVSTDPAHSLGDVLDVPLSSRVSRARVGRRILWAMELDAPRAYGRWLSQHRRGLGDAIEHGTWLDREDVDALVQLTIPGVDELVALLEIMRVATQSRAGYDTIVVDTAPTGHTLRLLAAPETVSAIADMLDGLQADHRLIRQQLARVGRPEAADRLIALLEEQAQDAASLLRDPERARFRWVLLPEALSVAESEDGLRALNGSGIHVPDVIVNRVLPAGPACPICDRRRDEERRVIAEIPRCLPHRPNARIVWGELREPRGQARLARIGRQLVESPAPSSFAVATGSARRPEKGVRLSFPSLTKGEQTVAPERMPEFDGARLFMFAGKGGAGKSTAAAATAVRLARADPKRRVLLLSTDPAHSLGDVFEIAVGDRPRTIPHGPRNLHVRELDAPAALAKRRAGLEAALREIAAAFGPGESESAGSRGVDELIELAPPGIDELLGILEVAEQLQLTPSTARGSSASFSGRADVVIVDAAPTGHALRLLEMPDAAREWVQVLIRMLLKYRRLVRPGQLAMELLTLSKSIRRLRALLHDPVSTRCVIVTRAAAVARLETQRLIGQLRRLKLHAPVVIVNAMTLTGGRCSWCRATAAAERRELAALERATRRRSRQCAIILTPLSAPPPRGVVALDRWAASWRRASGP